VLARHQSGRRLFVPAMGRPVLAWGPGGPPGWPATSTTTAHVREVDGLPEIQEALERGPTLVLVGPERSGISSRTRPTLAVHPLAVGPEKTPS